MTKNLMIIDGAVNCTFDVFNITDEQFKFIFPAEGQELECIDALVDKHGDDRIDEVFKGIFEYCHMNKGWIEGIHGTLFYEYPKRRALYPSLRWYEHDTPSDFDESAPLGTDKNIMIDDRSHECRYDMYRISEEQFLLLFPDRKMYQEFEYREDLVNRHGEEYVAKLLADIKKRRYRNKANVMGHHGTVYLADEKYLRRGFPHKNYYRNNWKRYRWDEEDDKEWGYADDAKSE